MDNLKTHKLEVNLIVARDLNSLLKIKWLLCWYVIGTIVMGFKYIYTISEFLYSLLLFLSACFFSFYFDNVNLKISIIWVILVSSMYQNDGLFSTSSNGISNTT